MSDRSEWKSQIGFLIAAIGSAVGLGNIWRFGYMVHQHGGSAFLISYFSALLIAGIPIMILEYGIGHRQDQPGLINRNRHGINPFCNIRKADL